MADLLARLTSAVIRVGDGRGFIVKDAGRIRLGWRGAEHIVITAAHCLPSFPPCHAASDLEERTYQALLGPLGQEPTVWTECLFVDPIGDIAVLGPPGRAPACKPARSATSILRLQPWIGFFGYPKIGTARD